MKFKFNRIEIEVPPKAQFLQWFAHMAYIFLGIYAVSLYRIPSYYFVCLAISGVAEVLIVFIRSRGKILKVPITSFISTGTFYMFVESVNVEVYILGSIVTVLSKYLFRFDNKHVFNPGNVAVLFVVLLLPMYAVSVPGQWGGDLWLVILVGVLGAIVATYAKRIWVAAAYLIFFVLLSSVRALVFNISPLFLAGPILGVPAMIYMFHMITDPVTSPSTLRGQIIYGAVIALCDVLLRFFEIIYAPIIALLIVTALQPLVSILYRKSRLAETANTAQV